MNNYIKELIEEHSQLVDRINKLNDDIYNKKNNDDKFEFANKLCQLRAMKIYELALITRLLNNGIDYDGCSYFEKIVPKQQTTDEE
uniref:Uncharacterized protein n=1 Tax=Geladintestivirus 2 TaxID=3233134 RepID=A0AAU8MIR2_9CAUD